MRIMMNMAGVTFYTSFSSPSLFAKTDDNGDDDKDKDCHHEETGTSGSEWPRKLQ